MDPNGGTKSPERRPRGRRLSRFLLFAVIVIAVVAVLAPRFVIGPLIKHAAISSLEKKGAAAKIRRLRYSYFRGVTAKSVSIVWDSSRTVEARKVAADLGISAVTGKFSIEELRIGSCHVALDAKPPAGQTSGVEKKKKTPKQAGAGKKKKKVWRIDRLRVDAVHCNLGNIWSEPVAAVGITMERAGAASSDSGEYKIAVKQLSTGINSFKDLKGDLKMEGNNQFTLSAASTLNAGGRFKLDFMAYPADSGGEYHADVIMDGALPSRHVAKLLRYIHPIFSSLKSDHIRGSLSVETSLSAHGMTSAEILDSLSGTGEVTLAGGTLKLPGALAALMEFNRKAHIGSDGTVPVPDTTVEFAIKQGRIHNDDLRVGRAVLGAYAKGWTSTRGEVDQLILVKALEMTGGSGEVLAKLVGEGTIPLVHVTGTIGGDMKYRPCIDQALSRVSKVPRGQMENLLKKLPDADRDRLLDSLNSGQDKFVDVFRGLLEKAVDDLSGGRTGAGDVVEEATTALERNIEKTRLRRWKKRWKRALAAGMLQEYRNKCVAEKDAEELEALDNWLREKGVSPENIPKLPEAVPEGGEKEDEGNEKDGG
ncbi:MAG: hypothetical protein ACYS8W_05130 [Planctomycetota bacterium]